MNSHIHIHSTCSSFIEQIADEHPDDKSHKLYYQIFNQQIQRNLSTLFKYVNANNLIA